MKTNYVRPERVQIKTHPALNEEWVQTIIADDPSVLGLGELVLIERERRQPGAGRLDLLLRDSDAPRRYELELQLGATDESHIIRAIEYWDYEKKRYPQYDHCAVLVAEDITSRLLNVIALFNGTFPFIAIQMQAYMVVDHLTLVFTKVMDEISRGPAEEDEETESVNRAYWENRATKKTVALADKVFETLYSFDKGLELNYNKNYIGLKRNGIAYNFVTFKPIKSLMRLLVYLPQTDEVSGIIAAENFETLPYSSRGGCYRLQLRESDIESKSNVLEDLLRRAYNRRANI